MAVSPNLASSNNKSQTAGQSDSLPSQLMPGLSHFISTNLGDRRTFSYDSCEAYLILPFQLSGRSAQIKLNGLNLVSVSMHRDKYMVTKFGNSGPVGDVYGHRLTAGSFGFTVLGGNPFSEAIAQYAQFMGYENHPELLNVDDLPSLDIKINFISESQTAASMTIWGFTVLDQAYNVSIENISLGVVYSWIAKGCSGLELVSKITTGVQQTIHTPSTSYSNNTLFDAPGAQ